VCVGVCGVCVCVCVCVCGVCAWCVYIYIYIYITITKEIFRDEIEETTSQRPAFASRADTLLNCRCQ